jgi:hypothetical protein
VPAFRLLGPQPTLVYARSGRQLSAQIKIKLGFLLSRQLSGRELKSWLRAVGAPVDPSTLNAIQLTYIVPPRFSGGLHDPVPRRSGVWRGLTDVVEVPDELPELEHLASHGDVEGFGSIDGLDELIAGLRERLRGEAHVREHISAAIRTYVRDASSVDAVALAAALASLAEEFRTATEAAGYNLASLVDWHLARAPPPAEQPAPHFAGDGDELDGPAASRRLRAIVDDAVDAAFDHRDRDPPQLGIRAAAGLGKTRADSDPVGTYAQAVTDGRVPANRLVRRACERHIEDLSDCLRLQGCCHGDWVFRMAFRKVSSLRMAAVMATLAGLPRAVRRW